MRRRRPLLYPKPHTAAATAASKLGDILLVASITKTYPSALNLFCSYKIVGSLVVITLVSKLGAVRLCFRFRLLWPYRASLQFDIDAVA